MEKRNQCLMKDLTESNCSSFFAKRRKRDIVKGEREGGGGISISKNGAALCGNFEENP